MPIPGNVNGKPGGSHLPKDGANEKQRLSDDRSPGRSTDDHYPRRQSSKVDANTCEPPLPTVPPSRSTVSPNEAQQLEPQLLRTTLPHHIPLATRRPSPSSVRGKSLNGPSLRSTGPTKRNRASNKSLPIREDSDSDVVVFKNEHPRHRRQFPPFGMNQSDGSPVTDHYHQYTHSPLGDPTNRDNRSHRSSHPSPTSSMAQKSLSHSRTLPKRPPISEQEPIPEVDSPRVLAQSNQRLDRQYRFPDNFSERIYQHSFNYLWLNIVADTSGAQRLWNTLREESERMKTLGPFSGLAKSHRYRMQLLQVASSIGVSNKSDLRDALQKDEEYIFNAARRIMNLGMYREGRLQGDDMRCFLSLIQMILDGMYHVDEDFRRQAHHFLVTFCETPHDIASSPIITEPVTLLSQMAISGDAVADIYQASYGSQIVALKRLRLFSRGAQRLSIHQTLCKEAAKWRGFDNPFVLPFLGLDVETFSPFISMVSPWMRNGTILKHLGRSENGRLGQWMFEVAKGLEYLHAKECVHGDLKAANILIDDDGHVRIMDFGLTVVVENDVSNGCSSVRWMASELLSQEVNGFDGMRRSMESDVYALGCTLWEIYTGLRPFHDIVNDTVVSLHVVRGLRPKRSLARPVSDQLWRIIEQCWAHRPVDRPKIGEVVEMMRRWYYDL